MRVVGVSLVRNADRLDFPIVEAVRSILPLADSIIVNLGTCGDTAGQRVRDTLPADRLTLLERQWPDALGGGMLAVETQAALDRAQGDWAIYIQADEVLHEDGVEPIRRAMQDCLSDRRVEGLLVRFIHHYGDPDTVATGRNWYRREVRVVRLGVGAVSHHEAQGFRIGPGRRRVRARLVNAAYHHYGWSRPARALAEKRRADLSIYGRAIPPGDSTVLPWEYGLQPSNIHPALMRDWIAARAGTFATIGPRRWTVRQLRNAASDRIERLTGARLWEYRNYVTV